MKRKILERKRKPTNITQKEKEKRKEKGLVAESKIIAHGSDVFLTTMGDPPSPYHPLGSLLSSLLPVPSHSFHSHRRLLLRDECPPDHVAVLLSLTKATLSIGTARGDDVG